MSKKKLAIIIAIISVIILCLFLCFNNQKKRNDKFIMPNFGDINNYLYNSAVVNFNYASMASKNVQTALDELYTSIIGGCGTGYTKASENAATYTCNKNNVNASQTEVFDAENVKYNYLKSNSTGTNVRDSIIELATMRSDCKTGYSKVILNASSYSCKKNLIITANEQIISYGESIDTGLDEVIVSGLLEGHAIHSITLTPSTAEITNNGTITPSNVVVYDANNNDVTSTYNITYIDGHLTISAYVCKPPTAVTVATNGVVTWTESNTADSYEISLDGTNYDTATNGNNYNNAITSMNGTRTVYVRSVCNGEEYSSNHSSAAIKTVNVYSVTLTYTNGIDNVTGAGNYIVGSEVTIVATVKTGYTWTKWLAVPSGETISTNRSYSGIISNNWSYKATATGNSYTVNYNNGNGTNTTGSTKIGSSTCTFGTSCTLTTWATLGAVFPYSSSYSTDRGWSFYGWANSTSSTSRTYADGASINPTTYNATINLYSLGRKTYRFNRGIAPKSYTTAYQYWNACNTNASYRTSINVPAATSLSSSSNGSWEFLGYIGGSNAATSATVHFAASVAGTTYNPIIDTGSTGYMRSKYKRTLTVKYNSNGGSGSMSNTTLTQYYNSGHGNANGDANTGATLGDYTITLKSNSFSPNSTRYGFNKWADGSTSGTQYAAGASYSKLGTTVKSTTLTTTMYALWKDCCSGYLNIQAWSNNYCYRGSTSYSGTCPGYLYNGTCYTQRYSRSC